MSNLTNIQRKLAEGISAWLLFEFHCFRGNLFNEKYLSYPIGQILSGAENGMVKSEVDHPILKKYHTVGRPPQLDFVVVSNQKEWRYAVESKWVGTSEISIVSIIWDLMRLQVLADENELKCFFVLSGFDKKLKKILKNTHLIDLDLNAEKPITSLSKHFLKFHLDRLDLKSQKFLEEKFEKYPQEIFSDIIKCKPAHFYPNETINMSFKTFVWEVLPNK